MWPCIIGGLFGVLLIVLGLHLDGRKHEYFPGSPSYESAQTSGILIGMLGFILLLLTLGAYLVRETNPSETEAPAASLQQRCTKLTDALVAAEQAGATINPTLLPPECDQTVLVTAGSAGGAAG